MQTNELSTVDDSLRFGRALLQPSRSAGLDTRLLLSNILSVPVAWLFAHDEAALSSDAQSAFLNLLGRRAAGEPIAYLRGFREWRDLTLCVTPDVLIPRPETEVLVDHAIELARDLDARLIADVGTGSGAIAIALARALPAAHIVALDNSALALAVAAHNVEQYDLSSRITMLHGDLVDPLREKPDMLAANLPYLSAPMMDELDKDVRYEPAEALYGGRFGTELYERLLGDLSTRKWRVPVLFEFEPFQATRIGELIGRALGRGKLDRLLDLAGDERVVRFIPSPP